MQHLALRDEVLYGARDVLDRYFRIDPMLVQKIDAVGLQTLQGGVDDFADVGRPAVDTVDGLAVELETKLRRDDDAIALTLQATAEQCLVRKGAVGFGRVEEEAAEFDRAI